MSSWQDAADHAADQLPDLVSSEEWISALLTNTDLLGAILRALLTVGQPNDTRGVREVPDVDEGLRRWRRLTAGFSDEPFPQALRRLLAETECSLRDAEARTGLSKSHIGDLTSGKVEPTLDECVTIAAAFDRSPLWFHIYRVGMISGAVAAALSDRPERSADIISSLFE